MLMAAKNIDHTKTHACMCKYRMFLYDNIIVSPFKIFRINANFQHYGIMLLSTFMYSYAVPFNFNSPYAASSGITQSLAGCTNGPRLPDLSTGPGLNIGIHPTPGGGLGGSLGYTWRR